MFTKKQFTFLTTVLIIISSVTVVNLFASYRKSRDNERKNDLGDIVKRIGDYEKRFGSFPLSSEDGKIIGCNGFQDKLGRWFFKPCEWAENKVNSPFFDPLPHDPYVDKGRHFVYRSNGKTFQLYAALEGTYEDEYDKNILARGISCGDVSCNAGRTNDASIEVLYSDLPPTQ